MTGNIDAVVVAYRSESTLSACLWSLEGVVAPQDIVVVDHGNGSDSQAASDFGVRTMTDPANPGFGAGQNRGRAVGKAPYVLMCNPDAVVRPEAVTDGLAVLENSPDVAAVTGVILDAGSGRPERSSGRTLTVVHVWGRLLRLRHLFRLAPARALARRIPMLADYVDRVPPRDYDVEYLSATILLARRDALEQVGGFDQGYFLYCEDVDLCYRLRIRGWRLVAMGNVWGSHTAGSSSPDIWRHELDWWRGCLRFASLWYPNTTWWLAQAAGLVASCEFVIRRPMTRSVVWQYLVAEPTRLRRHRVGNRGSLGQ